MTEAEKQQAIEDKKLVAKYHELINRSSPRDLLREMETMQASALFNFACVQKILSVTEEILSLIKKQSNADTL